MESQHAVFAERFTDHLTFTNRIIDPREHAFEHCVSGGLASDVDRFQNGNTAGDERPESTCGTGQNVLFDESSKNRDLDDEHVKAHASVPDLPHQFHENQKTDRHRQQQEPVTRDVVAHGNQQQGWRRSVRPNSSNMVSNVGTMNNMMNVRMPVATRTTMTG